MPHLRQGVGKIPLPEEPPLPDPLVSNKGKRGNYAEDERLLKRKGEDPKDRKFDFNDDDDDY